MTQYFGVVGNGRVRRQTILIISITVFLYVIHSQYCEQSTEFRYLDLRLLLPRIWHRVVRYISTDISEEIIDSNFRVEDILNFYLIVSSSYLPSIPSILKVEIVHCSETSLNYQASRHHLKVGSTLNVKEDILVLKDPIKLSPPLLFTLGTEAYPVLETLCYVRNTKEKFKKPSNTKSTIQ